jgi:hypothetical protein
MTGSSDSFRKLHQKPYIISHLKNWFALLDLGTLTRVFNTGCVSIPAIKSKHYIAKAITSMMSGTGTSITEYYFQCGSMRKQRPWI